jgi:hypothetical protein
MNVMNRLAYTTGEGNQEGKSEFTECFATTSLASA